MATYKGLVDAKELLDFSQNFGVTRSYAGSRLFPDIKTQYFEAEYYRLVKNGNLPQVAKVHAFDTEAAIGSRVPIEKVELEELLIKEKINQTEELRKVTRGMRMDNVRDFVFDDIARQAEKVVARAELAKMEALAKGKVTLNENNLSLVVDYGIPQDNYVHSDWYDKGADVLGDIVKWFGIAEANGVTVNHAITSRNVLTLMMQNEGVQKAVFGNSGAGQLPELGQVERAISLRIGTEFTIEVNEGRYAVQTMADGANVLTPNRFFPEDTFVMCSLGNDGAVGTGLWGVTPEEAALGGAFDSRRMMQFVTVTQWETPDPVAVWTKASGLFVPVIPNPYGQIIAKVDVSGEAKLNSFGVSVGGNAYYGTINEDGGTVSVSVPSGTVITACKILFSASPDATVKQGDTKIVSGTTEVSFTTGTAKTFTVTAEDGVATKDYAVTVTVAQG